MSEFILIFRGEDAHAAEQSPEAMQANMLRWMEWMDGLQKQGKFIGAQPLKKSGRIINGNKKIITDGPFMEGKEMVAGYLLCKADSYDEAVRIANNCPILVHENGSVEVREIEEMKM
ncbi:MAG: YciI family protein [Bacteroidota bacterium]